MQLLTSDSEEGILPGLGWIPGSTMRFHPSQESQVKVPHMGWNSVKRSTHCALTEGMEEEERFYFVHSFYVRVKDDKHSMLRATHGIEFDAAIQCGNIFGVQFHPEKSHKFGMRFLKRFSEL